MKMYSFYINIKTHQFRKKRTYFILVSKSPTNFAIAIIHDYQLFKTFLLLQESRNVTASTTRHFSLFFSSLWGQVPFEVAFKVLHTVHTQHFIRGKRDEIFPKNIFIDACH